MTTFKRIANHVTSRALALATVGAIGFTAMGDVAQAANASGVKAPAVTQVADRGDNIQLARRGYHIRCETAAIRRNGRRLRGTYSAAVRKSQRRACRIALRECRHRLNRERRHDRRAYPFARCRVIDTDRVIAGRGRGRGPSIILRF